jgi:hypothetical protein
MYSSVMILNSWEDNLIYRIKIIIGINFLLAIFQISITAPVHADSIGASFILLSIHTNPGTLALREQYPRRIDSKGNYVITPGIEAYYQQSLKSRPLKMDSMRYFLGAGYDCADLKYGFLHWGGRWVFSWTEKLQLEIGLGPTLFFRESWTKRFAEMVADEEGFWIESENFLPGYQHKWLIGGNLELQYEIAPNWHAYWGLVPAVIIVMVNSFGVRYSF